MANHIKNGTIITRVMCAVFFLLFTYLYLYCYQADILAVTQHVLSKGITHYNRFVGAILITLVLCLLQVGVYVVSKLNGLFHALTYLPSFLLLGILTDVTPNLKHEDYIGHWYWLFPLLMVAFGFVLWMCRQFETIHQQGNTGNGLRILWFNLLTMVLMSLAACAIGNNDSLFHHRMRMETCMMESRIDDALSVGYNEAHTDSSLTFLRIWALSQKHLLGERLFEYPLMGKSNAMLPNGMSVHLMMVPEKRLYKQLGVVFKEKMSPKEYFVNLHTKGWAKPGACDWLLCAYLLDGDLDSFVKALPKYYDVESNLPKHYREALILYSHIKNQPVIVYQHPVLEADYEDYQALRKKTLDPLLRYTNLRDNYGKTYWFYFYSLQNQNRKPVRERH